MTRGNSALGSGSLSLLLCGTGGTLLGKVLFQLEGTGLDGSAKHFEKPWASTTFMFIGMAACLPAAAVARRVSTWLQQMEAAAEGNEDATQPLLERHSEGSAATTASQATSLSPAGPPAALQLPPGVAGADAAGAGAVSKHTLLLLLVPTLFDLAATVLMSVGLLYVTASIYQMMRGSEIVFTALLSTLVLHRHLNRWHLAGIAICIVGITTVGCASVLEERGEGPRRPPLPPQAQGEGQQASGGAATLLGMLLIVAAEAVQAAQVVVEDFYIHSSLALAPLTIVGCEGVLGTLLMLYIMLPAVQLLPGHEGRGLHEDSWDTLYMLVHSPQIRAVSVWLVVLLALYNIAGMLVTDSLGAVTRTVLETMRTLFIWQLNLLLYYSGPVAGMQLGEPWTRHSWLQALGFAVLVAGTLVYGHGEELQEKWLRAKLRWARLRESLARLVPSAEAYRPLMPPRIAGPGRIRTAFLQRAVVAHMLKLLAARTAAAAAAAPATGGGGHASGLAAALERRSPSVGSAPSSTTWVTGREFAAASDDEPPSHPLPLEDLEP